jgi:peptidoglycan/LPS O-acetylase OafA/YrhL
MSGRTYFPELDGVRAAAVLGVVAFHVGGPAEVGGRLGVDAFFVLSGFLITRLLVAEHLSDGRIRLAGFFSRRARRLLPALAATTLLTLIGYGLFVHEPLRGQTTGPGVVGALTYSTAWIAAAGVAAGGLKHVWSLSIEEHFYVLWPLILQRALQRGRPLVVVGSLYAAAASWRVAGWALGWNETGVYYRPDMRAHELLAGCMAALLIEHIASRYWKLAAFPALALVGTTVAAFGKALDLAPDAGPLPVLFAIAVAVVIVRLVIEPWGWISHILSIRPVLWVGRRSYGIYLIHLPIASALISREDELATGWQLVVLTVGATFLLAEMSYRFIEQPVRQWRSHPRRVAPSPGATMFPR